MTTKNPPPRSIDTARPVVSANRVDGSEVLDTPVLVPRESKVLARKTVAEAAHNRDDCRELLHALGLYDLDTLPEPPREC